MANSIEEIKSRIDIVELISEYVQLRQTGANYRALCPFHSEKAPSFFVSPERQAWHCFGSCNEGGDIFKFIMKMENIDFPEALRILAQKAGVELSKGDYQASSQRTKILDLNKLAANFYHLVLKQSSLAEKSRQYLKDRGVKEETIEEFQLGFAPDRWDELVKFLAKKKIKNQDAELAGLLAQSNKSFNGRQSSHYDRFRNRIMFPINDVYGNVVGFTSRIVPWAENSDSAKYVNTPETPVYNKSRVLYGFDKAKNTIKKENVAIIVEGNMDVIACHQAGSKNVIASSGTALTLEQIKLLKRYTHNLYFAFDVDLAGNNATQRGIDLALREEMNVKVISIPEGKDPDECIKENKDKWFEAIEKAKSIMEYYFDFAMKDRDMKNAEDKKAVNRIILPVISNLGDPVEQSSWLKFLADKIDVPEYSLRDKLKDFKNKNFNQAKEETFNVKCPKEQIAAELFFGLLLRYPDFLKNYFLLLPMESFATNNLKSLAEIVKNWYNLSTKSEIDLYLADQIKNEELLGFVNYLGLLAEKEYSPIIFDKKGLTEKHKKELNSEAQKLIQIVREDCFRKKCTELTKQLKEAEKTKNNSRIKELSTEISKINREIHQL